MTPTFPPIDPATISGLNAGDEQALEKIFRTHYPVLLQLALDALPETPASAPRVVASAVRDLWDNRASVQDSAAAAAFLTREVANRAEATRVRMRAVQRFEKHEGVTPNAPHAAPDADRLWAEVKAALHEPAVDQATVARRRREQARHGAAGHIATMGAQPTSWKVPTIIGLVAALAAVGLFYWLNQSSREQVIERMLTEAEVNAVTTMPGQLGSLQLADGSAVRLGAESRLVTVPDFGDRYRTVRVTGTGSFTVAAENETPFEVRTAAAIVSASSGVLSVRDYADEPHATVRVDGGEAQVSTTASERTVAAGQTVVVERDGTIRDATAAEGAQAFAWADGRLVLNDVTAGTAVSQLKRWYGMTVAIVDSSAVGRVLSLDVPLDSSQAAIEAIEKGAELRFGYRERQMVFERR